jgi:hypothetical protein
LKRLKSCVTIQKTVTGAKQMMEQIKKLLAIKDEDGEFVLDADDVAKIVNKHRNSVYESRKGDCKLDKLAIFFKLKELVETGTNNGTVLAGDKDGLINSLGGLLDESTKYKITVQKG